MVKKKVGVNRVPAHKEVITPYNVKRLGENIAAFALKKLSAYHGTKELDELYFGLIRDIHSQNNPTYVFSDGYDYAQTACCFLCEHIGETLGTIIKVKYRETVKSVTVIHACTSMLGRLYYERKQYFQNTVPVGRKNADKEIEMFEENNIEEQHNKVDEIIRGMHLTKKQVLTLDCYMQGMGVTEISQVLHKSLSTIWRRRLQIQQKYLSYMGY